MNITKAMSGNVEQSYQSIIRNSNKDDYKKKLQIRKSPLNTKALLEHYYYSFNRSPPGHEYNQRNYYQNDLNIPQQKYMKKYDTDFINLDENINIDDYIKKNQNRKKIKVKVLEVKELEQGKLKLMKLLIKLMKKMKKN